MNYEKRLDSYHLFSLIRNMKAFTKHSANISSFVSIEKPHGRGFDPTLICM